MFWLNRSPRVFCSGERDRRSKIAGLAIKTSLAPAGNELASGLTTSRSQRWYRCRRTADGLIFLLTTQENSTVGDEWGGKSK